MPPETRRERQRRILIEEILTAARSQLEAGGPGAVSLRGISRAVGMSAPSLYTYFPSLSHVFTELIVASFRSLADAVSHAVKAVSGDSLEQRLLAGPRAYRTWALTNPQHFNLVFFDQIVGYQAPPDGPTVDAQVAVLQPIANQYAQAQGIDAEVLRVPGTHLDGFLAWWGAFHGLVALEVNHHLDWVDPASVFERRLQSDVTTMLTGSP